MFSKIRPHFLRVSLFFGLLSVFSAASCSGDPAGDGKCMVWKVEGEKATVYLAGSIHVLRKEDYPLPAAYDAAYADSSRLAFELPPGAASDPKTAMAMMAAGSYPAGETMDDHLSEDALKELNAYLKKSGMPAQLKTMRPWLFSVAISMQEMLKLGANPDIGVDKHYEDRAKKDKKPAEGLESVEDQVSVFSTLTEEQQEQMLVKTLAELSEVGDVFKGMLESWKTGDAEGLHRLMTKEADDFPELMEALLDKRNANWMEQITGYIEGDENVMVIVGAGHLSGEGSVIDLLEKKGYKPVQQAGK